MMREGFNPSNGRAITLRHSRVHVHAQQIECAIKNGVLCRAPLGALGPVVTRLTVSTQCIRERGRSEQRKAQRRTPHGTDGTGTAARPCCGALTV